MINNNNNFMMNMLRPLFWIKILIQKYKMLFSNNCYKVLYYKNIFMAVYLFLKKYFQYNKIIVIHKILTRIYKINNYQFCKFLKNF